MKRRSESTPADIRMVDAFLSDCERLSVEQWERICEHRAERKREILKADGEWKSVSFAVFKRVDPEENAEDDALQDSINHRMVAIAAEVPDKPWRQERATFRTLVLLAMRQAVHVLRIYTEAMKQKDASKWARPLTEAFEGFARLPGIGVPAKERATAAKSSPRKKPSGQKRKNE